MTRVVADTTCGLPPDVYRRLGIPMIPQVINFGDESFREGVDIDAAAFMAPAAHREGDAEDRRALPRRLHRGLPGVLSCGREHRLHPSFGRCERHRALRRDREERLPRRRHPHHRHAHRRRPAGDARARSRPRWRSRARARTRSKARVREMMARAQIYFLVDTLEFLRRGGRIGGAQALDGHGAADQADPHPSSTAASTSSSGSAPRRRRWPASRSWCWPNRPAAQRRTSASAMPTRGRRPRSSRPTSSRRWARDDVLILDMPPAIVTHAGPGTLAFGFFTPGLRRHA